jgi:hypothetical protein
MKRKNKPFIPEVEPNAIKTPIKEADPFWDMKHDIFIGKDVRMIKLNNMRIDPADGITYYTGTDILTGKVFNHIEYTDIINP